MTDLTRAAAEALDRQDGLAGFRDAFVVPEGVIYLDGNSLGALPKATQARVAQVIEQQWGQSLIRAWNQHGWIDWQFRLGDQIAALIGAPPDSVVVADSTSVNLFKLLAAALQMRPDRQVILSETGNFPTDLYIAQGLGTLLRRGHELRTVAAAELPSALDRNVAVLMLTQVDYRTGALHDMAALTKAAHDAGALVLWDLSHSAGALEVDLETANADFAVGCGYKYLNGGPGAPAFLFVAPRLQAELRLPLTGWLGHADPFAFEPAYRPAEGIARAVVGTPPILSLSALEVGVELMCQAGMARVRAKSLALGELFIALLRQFCGGEGFTLLTPTDPGKRGSQISLAHEHAYAIMQALIARGMIGDFRAPNVARFGLTPMYLRFTDIWDAVSILREVMQTQTWRDPRFNQRHKVT
jgi:kynureninase